MREIKFRVWKNHYRKMLTHEDLVNNGWNFSDLNFPESQSVLMQYTGLKDKNGKEIYEGDIYDFGMAQSVIRNFIENTYLLKKMIEDGARVEIIGNIYENPELLK